ncbi:MAG: hypothetical protein BMS9Abin01_2041 [Gammaproteobacteria bacterium]|nr:MAG: hypothetical protein BMS9Abin01_2041 [Gammaproteobacteria bacterium]
MNVRGAVKVRVNDNTMRVYRALSVVVAAALLTVACAGGGLAPVAERSTVAAGDGRSTGTSGTSVVNAASEAPDNDWTATVRPLGASGGTASRVLPSEQAPPATASASADPAAAAAAPAAPAPRAALGSGSQLRSTSSIPGLVPPASMQSSATVNVAVVSLLNTASAQSRAGDYARAAATLERAIAIEPDNAWLWYRLADTRLEEGRLEQAAGLAAKSNSLATADRSLQADNWRLIAEARRRQGDAGAAAAAESKAARLSNL